MHAISLQQTVDRLRHGSAELRPLTIQALRLGALVLVCCDLEVFHTYQRQLQAAQGPDVLIASCTNGYRGYAPSREAFSDEMDPYAAYQVPYYLGSLPFTADFEDR